MKRESYTVSDVARLAKVTVRTLHHYDELGLLTPSGRTEAGYRLYGPADLERLHQILLYRGLGFPLEAIQRLLDEPATDRRTALLGQRELLLEQVKTNEAMLRALDQALAALQGGTTMDPKTMFDGFDPAQYEEEVKARWGHSDAYKESTRRFKGYKEADFAQMKAEGAPIFRALVAVMTAGAKATDMAPMDLVEAYRLYIDKWFYPCDHAQQERLADLYVNDARYGAFFEKQATGLTQFVADAIRANARRQP